VLPSYLEGLPMSLLEAMAAGLPVITTPVGGIPDVVTDGTEGLLIKPRDAAALARAMATLIEDEAYRLQLGRHARVRAEDFDVSHFASQLTDIYRRVLK
jgi:glycosyltransferase involved in cell wall biosynthesis